MAIHRALVVGAMSAIVKLAALVLKQAEERYDADAKVAYERSRKLREREGTPDEEDGDDYEIGYAEGRHSTCLVIARDLKKLGDELVAAAEEDRRAR